MIKNGKWLKQKLAQNGFGPSDLAMQSGLSKGIITSMIENNEGTEEQWDLVLDILNQYPRVVIPSEAVLDDLQNDINEFGGDAPCIVFYGVNQNELAFCEYKPLESLQMHGANVPVDYLSKLQMTLQEALELFTKQNYSAMTFTRE